MTINPKLKIASGVALAGGGAFMFYQASKASDKKKKILYGIAGAGLFIGGFFTGKKGIVQVMGLKEQGKVIDNSSEPAKGIITDMEKEKAEVKKPASNRSNVRRDEDGNTIRTAPLAFDSGNKSKDSFDSIISSSAASKNSNIKTIPATQPKIISKDNNGNIISASRNDAVKNMGAKVVGNVDPKILERQKAERQSILSSISSKEAEHKKLIKASGWHAGLPLRNEIAILKTRLHYV